MPKATVNNIQLYYALSGHGPTPLLLLHGSWASHHTWDAFVPLMSEEFRMLAYDRRGHSQSERPSGQGSIREDVADLAALIEAFDLAPAWVVGNSQGGLIALRLAGERPELLRGVSAHEPPLFSLLKDEPAAASALETIERLDAVVAERVASGDDAGAAEFFIESFIGSGAWRRLPDAYRQELTNNAPTYVDEIHDPENVFFDPQWIRRFQRPVLLTRGQGLDALFDPMYARVAQLLPGVKFMTIADGGHLPQRYAPQAYAQALSTFFAGYAGEH